MTRNTVLKGKIIPALLLAGAALLTGCEVTFYGFDETPPVIERVSISPSDPRVGEEVRISATVYEPDSAYELRYDTDGDGRFDDSDTVTYYSAGSRTIRVQARSVGGTDEVAYSFYVEPQAGAQVWLRVYNDTANGVELTISAPGGSAIALDEYLAPSDEYSVLAYSNTYYTVEAWNQYGSYGPESVYVGSTDRYVDIQDLN